MEMPGEYRGREHTWLKHRVLSEYLIAWAHKLGSVSKTGRVRLWYVDCFAGPWRAREDLRDTSICIGLDALESAARTWGGFGYSIQVAAVFVEKDRAAFGDLQTYLQQRTGAVATHPIHSEFGGAVAQIERLIGTDAAFVFVDPTGWKGVGMHHIAPLLVRPRRDVLINVMFDHLNRFKDDPREFLRQQMREFFGLPEADIPSGLDEEGLMQLYRTNLKERGQIPMVADLAIPYPLKDRTKLRLVVGGQVVRLFRDVERKVIGGEASSVRADARTRDRERRTGQLALLNLAPPATDPRYTAQNEQGRTRAEVEILRLAQINKGISYEKLWPDVLQSCHITKSELKTVVEGLVTARRLTIVNRSKGERTIKDHHILAPIEAA